MKDAQSEDLVHECARLRAELERLKRERDHVATANVNAALEIAALSEVRQRELEEQSRVLREALEEARSAAVKKDEFLAKVSHELRTPLNGIIGMTLLLTDSIEQDVQREYAQTALDSARALLTIINDILDISKIQAGRLELSCEEFDSWRLVSGVVRLLAPRMDSARVRLHARIDPRLPRFQIGDAVRLRQILVNLCGNALKFTERGQIALDCERVEAEDGRARLRVEVADTGCGIPKESMGELFQSFRQIDNSSARKHGGTGLGLAICKHLVERMEGSIGVRSEVGVGSTFWFDVPLRSADRPRPRARAQRVQCLLRDEVALRRLQELCECLGSALEPVSRLEDLGDGAALVLIEVEACERRRLTAHSQRQQAAGIDVAWLMPFAASADLTRLPGVAPVWLPLCIDELEGLLFLDPGAHSEERAKPAAIPASGLRSANVLVVEDNQVNALLSRRLLEKLGHRARVAESGRRALELLAAETVDLVLMDCQMPGMDGYEATRAIRRREAEGGRRTPIVALTANAMASDRERCLAAGMDDYLSKPIELEALAAVLVRWLASED